MSEEKQYDDSNKGALWSAKGYAGKCDIDGKNFFVMLVATNTKSETAPSHMAIIRDPERRTDTVAAVFKVKKADSKAVASFKAFDKVFFVYKADPSENANAPLLRLSVMPDGQKQENKPATTSAANDFDEVPF